MKKVNEVTDKWRDGQTEKLERRERKGEAGKEEKRLKER